MGKRDWCISALLEAGSGYGRFVENCIYHCWDWMVVDVTGSSSHKGVSAVNYGFRKTDSKIDDGDDKGNFISQIFR